ncbi:hypothetical protein [uncultured Bacteroides sp.]|uniref:hypothetical protein n=1 Tax=uncultured Bacteroides sp. TaxID=162156 RepID=UPI002AAB369D|nr:hypothetical protein [uncultured Bacteroides sp.]
MSKQSIYSKRSNLTIGFHGCDRSIALKVLNGEENLRASENDYDWLGHGVYFWENNDKRALQFANDVKRRSGEIKEPAILGAILDLGHCMDLTDTEYLEELKDAYEALHESNKIAGIPMPQNSTIGKSTDKLIRKLDCAVIEYAHLITSELDIQQYDSVKGVFWEGEPLYPDAGFSTKNHIQICVRNPNCIKGFFLPRKMNTGFPNP